MTKVELVASIASKSGLTKKDSEKALTAFIDSVTATLKKGDKVALVGFGTFEVRNRPARTGLNPRTKEKIQIKATKSPAFKSGKSLKEAVK